jgi:hypothetical protein
VLQGVDRGEPINSRALVPNSCISAGHQGQLLGGFLEGQGATHHVHVVPSSLFGSVGQRALLPVHVAFVLHS